MFYTTEHHRTLFCTLYTTKDTNFICSLFLNVEIVILDMAQQQNNDLLCSVVFNTRSTYLSRTQHAK